MKIRIYSLTIETFVEKVKQPGFSFARYGDGTFMSLMGKIGYNCDGAQVSPHQAAEIRASILDDGILHGIGDWALRVGAEEWLVEQGIDIDWVDCNVMNTASHLGQLYPFIQLLRKRKVVMVGPEHVGRMKGFPVQHHVVIHPTMAFEEIKEIQLETEFAAERTQADTVLISAGPAAPPLVSRIHRTLPYLNVIDTGSIWDPYVGILSRKVHKKMGKHHIRELGRLNFKQEISSWWKT